MLSVKSAWSSIAWFVICIPQVLPGGVDTRFAITIHADSYQSNWSKDNGKWNDGWTTSVQLNDMGSWAGTRFITRWSLNGLVSDYNIVSVLLMLQSESVYKVYQFNIAKCVSGIPSVISRHHSVSICKCRIHSTIPSNQFDHLPSILEVSITYSHCFMTI